MAPICQSLSKNGSPVAAINAVEHAELLPNPSASIERAKVLYQQNRVGEALRVVDSVEIDISRLQFGDDKAKHDAKCLLLAAKWVQESGLRQEKKLIERYRAVTLLDPACEK